MSWLDEVPWNEHGLIAAVAQDATSGRVLTVAWMNREALRQTAEKGEAVYWSRSRGRLWRKGEQVGGIACHTGRESCFYRKLENGSWVTTDPVLKDPATLYKK